MTIIVLIIGFILSASSCEVKPSPSPTIPSTNIQGSFENKFIRYKKGQKYSGANIATWSDTAWQNDRLHKQIILWSDSPEFNNISYETSNLVNGSNTIPSSNIRLRFGNYILGDQLTQSCGGQSTRTTISIADALSTNSITTLSSSDPIKIWVTIDIPSNIATGIYKGTILVKNNNNLQQTLNIEMLVLSKVLPPVANWTFHLDLWQFPFQLLNIYNSNSQNTKKIDAFSTEYFALIEPYYRMLADAGQNSITTIIKDVTFLPGQTMVKWSKNIDGTWSYDFSNFNSYVEKMMSWGITKQINCFSLLGWSNNTSIVYFDVSSATSKTLTLDLNSSDYQQQWNSFLTAFKKNLDTKGWFDKTVLYMDEITSDKMPTIVSVIKNNNPNWKIGLAGQYVSASVENNLYEYSTIFDYNKNTVFSSDRVSTFYTSCTQLYPNAYVTQQNSPAEMTWMAWYAAQAGFNGYLRWAYDYWTSNDPTNILDGSNSAGDYSMIYRTNNSYPNPAISSIRFELLREGIQDFEKIRILSNAQLKPVIQKFITSTATLSKSLVQEAQYQLKVVSAKN